MSIDFTIPTPTAPFQAGITIPTWRAAQDPMTVIEVSTSNVLEDLDPIDDASINPNFPSAPEYYYSDWGNIIDAWCGACNNDTVIWFPLQGGHFDYGGNDPLKIDLLADAPEFIRLRPPSGWDGTVTTIDGQELTGLYSDGRTRATHSYNKPVYIPNYGPAMGVVGNASSAGSEGKSWFMLVSEITGEALIFGTEAGYSNGDPSGAGACYDPSRHSVWYRGKGTAKFKEYDILTDSWDVKPASFAGSGGVSLTYMTDYDRIFWGENGHTNKFAIYNPSTDTFTTPALTGSYVGYANIGGEGQWIYLPPGADGAGEFGSLAIWDNTTATGTINLIDIPSDVDSGTYNIRQLTFTGVTPTARKSNGTYGRFCYVPSLNGFYLLNDVAHGGYFFALGAV